MRLLKPCTTHSPIGTRTDGRLIWPVFGAQPDEGGDSDGDSGGDDGDSGGDDGGDDPEGQDGALGDAGKAAVERERKAAERLRKSLKPFAALRRETGLSVEEMRERLLGTAGGSNGGSGGGNSGGSNSGGQPVDIDAIRREERLKEREKYEKGLRSSAVEAIATSMLNDPDDAARFLDLKQYEVDEDGRIDKRQVRNDLERLISDRPYLAKAKKAPDFEGGPRGGGSGAKLTPGQMMNAKIREERQRRYGGGE